MRPFYATCYLSIECGQGRPEGLVFRRSSADPFSGSAVSRRAKAWKAAKLATITLHECRHRLVSLMIAAVVNAKALWRYMAHFSIVVTLDLYGHLMPGNEDEAARRLDASLKRADTAAHRAAVDG